MELMQMVHFRRAERRPQSEVKWWLVDKNLPPHLEAAVHDSVRLFAFYMTSCELSLTIIVTLHLSTEKDLVW